KAAALAAAERAAVELVVGVYVNAKTQVDKAVAIQSSILTHATGYIKRYAVLSEGRNGDWYKMKIRALVSTQALHQDLDQLGLLRQAPVGNPRVAIFLQEFVGEKENAHGAAARALAQGLINQGFIVVDLPNSAKPDEDPTDLAKTLSHASAELLIAGMARAQLLATGKQFGGMSSYRASISFRVLETGSAEVVQTVSETASGLEATPEIASQQALEKAAQLAANDLATLPQELSKRAHVDLTISGITSFDVLSRFEKSLDGQAGVKDLFLRSFSQSTGVAVLDVLIDQISPQELADRCVQLGGPAWSVYQVTGRSVQLSASLAGR
ncbi:MAG TPA: hypothetical protein VMU17_03335, partial [Elusimicrobiota bacterium]|nr:hypothetical protein [Elusimicrobiota bacterium]